MANNLISLDRNDIKLNALITDTCNRYAHFFFITDFSGKKNCYFNPKSFENVPNFWKAWNMQNDLNQCISYILKNIFSLDTSLLQLSLSTLHLNFFPSNSLLKK